MASNYKILRKSEEELSQHFKEFLDSIVKTRQTLVDGLKATKPDFQTLADNVHKKEKKNDRLYRDVVDKAVWIIQKDQPIANHLRFVIAIINSAKDLERMSDHANATAKFFAREKVPSDILKEFTKLLEKNTESIVQVVEYFKNNRIVDVSEIADEIRAKGEKEITQALIQIINSSKLDLTKNKGLYKIFFLIQYLERDVSHAINIISNFYYISSTDSEE